MEKISIHVQGSSTQSFPDTPEDTITFHGHGALYFKENAFSLSYEEKTEEGYSGTKTTISKENEILSLSRQGNTRWELQFLPEKPFAAVYSTPYGDFHTIVTTKKVEENISTQGGTIHLEYLLELQGGAPGKVIFDLEVQGK